MMSLFLKRFVCVKSLPTGLKRNLSSHEALKLTTSGLQRPFLKDLFVTCLNLDFIDFPELNQQSHVLKANHLLKEINEVFTKEYSDSNGLNDYLRAKNMFGLNIDEMYSGMGLNKLQFNKVAEGVKIDVIGSMSFLYHCVMSEIIGIFGTETQKSKYLSSLNSGQLSVAFSVRDLSGVVLDGDTVAVGAVCSKSDSNVFILNGTCRTIIDYKPSNLLFVLADIGERKENTHGNSSTIVAMLIDPHSPGISIQRQKPLENTVGHIEFYDLVFNDVPVSSENILGNAECGVNISKKLLTSYYLMISSCSVAFQKRLLNRFTEFFNEREVFGVPLISYEKVKSILVNLTWKVFVNESMPVFLCGLLDKMNNNYDFLWESLATNVIIAKTTVETTDQIIDCFGHNCLSEDKDYAKFHEIANFLLYGQRNPTLDCLSLGKAVLEYAASEERKWIEKPIFQHLACKFAFSSNVHCFSTNSHIKPKLSNYLYPRFAILAHHVFFELYDFSHFLNELLKKHGQAIFDDQTLLLKISEIVMDIWSIFPTLSRVNRSTCLKMKTYRHEQFILFSMFGEYKSNLQIKKTLLSNYCRTKFSLNAKSLPLKLDFINEPLAHPFNL